MLEAIKDLQTTVSDIEKQVDENEAIMNDLVLLVRSLEKRLDYHDLLRRGY